MYTEPLHATRTNTSSSNLQCALILSPHSLISCSSQQRMACRHRALNAKELVIPSLRDSRQPQTAQDLLLPSIHPWAHTVRDQDAEHPPSPNPVRGPRNFQENAQNSSPQRPPLSLVPRQESWGCDDDKCGSAKGRERSTLSTGQTISLTAQALWPRPSVSNRQFMSVGGRRRRRRMPPPPTLPWLPFSPHLPFSFLADICRFLSGDGQVVMISAQLSAAKKKRVMPCPGTGSCHLACPVSLGG